MRSKIQNSVEQLRERNIWRAAVACPAAAFVFLEAVEFSVDNYQLDRRFLSVAVILFIGALPIALGWRATSRGRVRGPIPVPGRQLPE